MANNDEILKLVESFGFKFFGYDEGNNTLVIAPNGQIVMLSIAYNFVKQQIAKSSQQPVGPESIPQIPALLQFENKPENNIEKKAEVQGQNPQTTSISPTNLQIQNKSPQMPAVAQEPDNPFGDSPKLSFNPAMIEKAQNFVNNNSQKAKTTTARWLSEQFKKFIEEQKLAA